MQTKHKKEAGITLIALVVTIIVLTILASVSLNSILGEKGMIDDAKETKLSAEQSVILENLRMTAFLASEDLGSLDYLKSTGKVREDNTVDVNVIDDHLTYGKGGKNGTYFIKDGELYYENGDTKKLGRVFAEETVLDEEITGKDYFTYADEGKKILTGVQSQYIKTHTWGSYPVKTEKSIADEDGTTVTEIVIPKRVVEISQSALADYKGLESVILNSKVERIGNDAFNGCYSLTTINLPDSIREIGERAFSGCALTSITLPANLTSISKSLFSGCGSLEQVVITKKITSIGDYAFSSCKKLKILNIPSLVASIGDSAFADWTSEQTINFQAASELASWNSNWKKSCNAALKWGVSM